MQKSRGRIFGVFKKQSCGWNGMSERGRQETWGGEGTGQQAIMGLGSYSEWDRKTLEG